MPERKVLFGYSVCDHKGTKGQQVRPSVYSGGLIWVHLMNSKQECAQALQVFAKDIGIPANLCTTGLPSSHSIKFRMAKARLGALGEN